MAQLCYNYLQKKQMLITRRNCDMLKKITSLFLTGALMLGAAATAEGVSGTFSGEGTGYGGTIAVDVTL